MKMRFCLQKELSQNNTFTLNADAGKGFKFNIRNSGDSLPKPQDAQTIVEGAWPLEIYISLGLPFILGFLLGN